MDIREHATRGNGHGAEQLIELLVVADGQLDVSRDDARLLVVARRIPCQLQDLGREVLEDSRQIDRGTASHPGGIAALLEEAADAAHGELELGTGGLGLMLRSFATPGCLSLAAGAAARRLTCHLA